MNPFVLAALLYALSPPSDPGDASAAQKAIEAYAEERWDDAVVALEQAYAEDPDPKYIFARAEALRAADRCEQAIEGFEAFLEQAASASDEAKAKAEDAIAGCRETLDASEPPPSTPPTTPVNDADLGAQHGPQPRPDDVDRAPRTWTRDGWGHGLTWSGVAIAGVGAGLLGEAYRRKTRADAALDEQSYANRLGPAPTLSRIGIPLLAVGAVVLTAGITRFIWVARGGGRGGRLARRSAP